MQIQCDNCERLFNVADDSTDLKFPCPYCGDINRRPESAPGASEPIDDAASRQPAASESGTGAGSGTEQTICTLRPAMGRAHPFLFLALILLGVGGIVLAVMSRTSEAVPLWALWPGLIMLVAAAVWWAIWWAATHLWLKLVVSNKRTIRQAGIIQRHTTEVLHDHVRSVDIQQSLLQRIFNVGTIGIDSAGQDDIEIVMHNMPRPYEVKKIIDRHRRM